MNFCFKSKKEILASALIFIGTYSINTCAFAIEEPIVMGITKSGLSHYRNARDVIVVLNALVEEEMEPTLGFPIEIKFYDTDRDMYSAVARKQADIGCGHLVRFLKYYNRGLVVPLLWFYQKNNPGDQYCLISRKGSRQKRAHDLKGLSLGYSDTQDMEKIHHVFYSKLKAFKAKKYFGKIVFYRNSFTALAALMNRDVDVVFDSKYSLDVYLEFYPREVEVILSAKMLADLPIFTRTSLKPKKREKIRKIEQYFLSMHKKHKTHQLLIFLGCDQVKKTGERQKKAYRQWIKEYKKMGLIQ